MKWYRRFSESLLDALERSGRMRALSVLRDMDPKILQEAGFSPDLLKLGVGAWPWRAEAIDDTPTRAQPVASSGEVSEANASQNRAERKPDCENAFESPASRSSVNTEIAA